MFNIKKLSPSKLSIIESGLSAISKFALLFLISRVLGAESQGIYTFAISTWATFTIFFLMGIDFANTFFAAKEEWASSVETLIGNSLIHSLVFSLLGTLGLIVFLEYFSNQTLDFGIKLLMIFGFLCFFFQRAIGGIIYGLGKFYEHLVGTLLTSLFLVLLVLISIFWEAFNIKYVIVYLSILYLISFTYWLGTILIYTQRRVSFNYNNYREQIKYGLKNYLYIVVNNANVRVDVYLIIYFLSPEMLGYYAIALAFSEVLDYLPKAINVVFLKQTSSENKINLSNLGLLVAFVLFLAIGIALIAPFVIPAFFGEDYKQIIIPLFILLGAGCFYSLGTISMGYLFGMNKGDKMILSAIIAFVIAVILNYFLIPKYGILGAAIAKAVSYGIFSIITIFYLKKYSNQSSFRFMVPNVIGILDMIRKWR